LLKFDSGLKSFQKAMEGGEEKSVFSFSPRRNRVGKKDALI